MLVHAEGDRIVIHGAQNIAEHLGVHHEGTPLGHRSGNLGLDSEGKVVGNQLDPPLLVAFHENTLHDGGGCLGQDGTGNGIHRLQQQILFAGKFHERSFLSQCETVLS